MSRVVQNVGCDKTIARQRVQTALTVHGAGCADGMCGGKVKVNMSDMSSVGMRRRGERLLSYFRMSISKTSHSSTSLLRDDWSDAIFVFKSLLWAEALERNSRIDASWISSGGLLVSRMPLGAEHGLVSSGGFELQSNTAMQLGHEWRQSDIDLNRRILRFNRNKIGKHEQRYKA